MRKHLVITKAIDLTFCPFILSSQDFDIFFVVNNNETQSKTFLEINTNLVYNVIVLIMVIPKMICSLAASQNVTDTTIEEIQIFIMFGLHQNISFTLS